MAYPLRVTGLARAIKDRAGKYNHKDTRRNSMWFLEAGKVICRWNGENASNGKWCSPSEQLQALSLAKDTERNLQNAIRKAQ